jgi:hypothetical protein
MPALVAGTLIVGSLLTGCGGSSSKSTATSIPGGASPAASASASASAAAATPAPDLKLLKFTPDTGSSGTTVTVTGDSLAPGKSAEFMWSTVDGSYDMTAGPENIAFNDRVFKAKRVSLGTTTTTADGKVNATFTVPVDYGEVHDVYLTMDGQDVARAGYRIMRKVTINPESGPIGTPISVTVTGLGSTQYTNTLGVRYDNTPTGIITAVTTRGTATGIIRAAGGVGKHTIDIDLASRGAPFLNNQQSGTANIPDQRFTFTITDASKLPDSYLDWPDTQAVANSAAAPKTTQSTTAVNANVKGSVAPLSGPILTSATITATGVPANADVEMFWVTARGNRVNPSGWALDTSSVGKATAGADGTFKATFQVPDDLGGWHVIKLVSGQSVLTEVPYFLERSLADVTPQKVKAGDQFTVHLKGVGWTELDNGTAITYDNAYIGFACGFNSNGDAAINLVATGQPGIHLIDLYPMIYQGHGAPPWGYEEPLLAFKQDAPGLSLGYRLPTVRVAIEIVP